MSTLAMCLMLALVPPICKLKLVRHYRFAMREARLKTVKRASDQASRPVTIVSSHFAHDQLDSLRCFLETVTQPIVLYTTPDLGQAIEDIRGDRPLHLILEKSIDNEDQAQLHPALSKPCCVRA